MPSYTLRIHKRYNNSMCGRYALFQTEQLRERFHIANNLPDGLKKRYNIGPTQLEPVIIDRSGSVDRYRSVGE